MNEQFLQSAIHENPEDDAPRLAYADWLAVNGQPDRAEWIRASCDYAALSFEDQRWRQAGDRVRDSWARCRPVWWEELTNINQKNDRGMFRFILGETRSARSIASIKRLNKAIWLRQAIDQGWILRVEASVDEELIKAIAGWNEPVSTIPLFVTALPQVGDETLRQIMSLPQLQGLSLPSHVVKCEAAREVAKCENLRDLTVEFRLVDPATVDAMLAQIVTIQKLRRLCLQGHERIEYGTRPNDADILRLARMKGLRRLNLSASPAVTDVGIAELRRESPSLIVDRNYVP